MKQLTHYDTNNSKKEFPITVVCDALRTPENIGMCFRICESFGVRKIFLHTDSPGLENKTVKRTARNTAHQIDHNRYDDFSQLIHQLKQDGHTIIGLEITDKSILIQDFNFSNYKKIVLILGNERKGIEQVQGLDHTVCIPMYGTNSSMNVIHSLAISLYEITNQLDGRPTYK